MPVPLLTFELYTCFIAIWGIQDEQIRLNKFVTVCLRSHINIMMPFLICDIDYCNLKFFNNEISQYKSFEMMCGANG